MCLFGANMIPQKFLDYSLFGCDKPYLLFSCKYSLRPKLGKYWVMVLVRDVFVLTFTMVQLCTAEYVVYGQKMTTKIS